MMNVAHLISSHFIWSFRLMACVFEHHVDVMLPQAENTNILSYVEIYLRVKPFMGIATLHNQIIPNNGSQACYKCWSLIVYNLMHSTSQLLDHCGHFNN
jgi:hypothetical protein